MLRKTPLQLRRDCVNSSDAVPAEVPVLVGQLAAGLHEEATPAEELAPVAARDDHVLVVADRRPAFELVELVLAQRAEEQELVEAGLDVLGVGVGVVDLALVGLALTGHLLVALDLALDRALDRARDP